MAKREPAERVEKRKAWEDHLKRWQESGLTQVEYCREKNLGMNRFVYWKKKITREIASGAELRVKRSVRSPASSRTWLVVGDHYRIEIREGFDPSNLEQILRIVSRL